MTPLVSLSRIWLQLTLITPSVVEMLSTVPGKPSGTVGVDKNKVQNTSDLQVNSLILEVGRGRV